MFALSVKPAAASCRHQPPEGQGGAYVFARSSSSFLYVKHGDVFFSSSPLSLSFFFSRLPHHAGRRKEERQKKKKGLEKMIGVSPRPPPRRLFRLRGFQGEHSSGGGVAADE